MSVPATAEPASPAQAPEAVSPGQAGATPAQDNRAGPTQVSDSENQEQPTRGPDFFRQAFQQLRPYAQSAAQSASSPAPQAPAASNPPGSEPERPAAPQPTAAPAATTLPPAPRQAPRTAQPQPDNRIVLTPDELARRTQAEADRIIAKRQRDAEAAAERDREVELRRTNPFEYARLMEARDQELQTAQAKNADLTQTLTQQLTAYDRNVLDIFVSAIPEPHRAKVISKNEGIPGRKETAAETLKFLRQTWTAEGRASAKAELMKDPVFVKEVLARFGGQTPEPEMTPVQVRPSAAASRPEDSNQAVNSWMRDAAKGSRQQTGRG